MKHLFKTATSLLTLATVALSLAVPVHAGDDDDKAPTRLEKRRASIMEQYEKTGEVKRCVPLNRLRNSVILDDKTIFFRATNSSGYLVEMAHRCPRLATEERFAYKTSIGSLCSNDIITVLDSFGRDWSSCGLAEFQVMKRRDKKDGAPEAADEGDASTESTDKPTE